MRIAKALAVWIGTDLPDRSEQLQACFAAIGVRLEGTLGVLVEPPRDPRSHHLRIRATIAHRQGWETRRAARGCTRVRPDEVAYVRSIVTDRDLVDAILRRDAAATRAFEQRFATELRRIATRLGVRDGTDELIQRLLVRILVGAPESPPRIAGFRGDGSLDAWVRAVATRFVIDHVRHLRAQPGTAALSESVMARSAAIDGAIQHGRYAAIVRASAEGAFAALTPRERNLLRHAVFHRLSVDEVGSIYRVHRATAARWLQRARERLHETIVLFVCEETGMPANDARSIVRELGGGDVSLRSVLSVGFEPDVTVRAADRE